MVFTLCTEFVNSPYIEPTASGLPNPTPVEGEVRFIQAPDQSVVSRRTPRQATTHLSRRASVNNGVLTHSLDVDLKIDVQAFYSHSCINHLQPFSVSV